MKLLSICIPTYNRNSELLELNSALLNPALNDYESLLDIIVCDNSDMEKASINKSNLDSRIIYRKNEQNIGFAGNIIRCANEANSKYIWIISDNDPVLYSGFTQMVAELQLAEREDTNCLMLPYQTTDIDGNKVPENRHIDYGITQETTVTEILKTGNIPFVLLSSAVIRLDKSVLDSVATKFQGNIYLQSIMYLEMVRGDSKVRFLEQCVIDYHTEYSGNFTVSAMARSMEILCQYLKNKFSIQIDPKQRYRVWLTILIHNRGGVYSIKDAELDSGLFIAQLHKYFNIRSLLLVILLTLPSCFFRPAYIAYRSFRDIRGDFSFRHLYQRLGVNRSYINSLKIRD